MINAIIRLFHRMRAGEAERELMKCFDLEPSMTEGLLIICLSPMLNVRSSLLWRNLGVKWQVETKRMNLSNRDDCSPLRVQEVPECTFREAISRARQWESRGKPKGARLRDGPYYIVAWGTPTDIHTLYVHSPLTGSESANAIACLESLGGFEVGLLEK